MGEGRVNSAFSETSVKPIATRDIYETTFDEDVQADSTVNQCPECDGRVITNAAETVCEDCGLVLDDQQIDHGPEWRSFDAAENEHKRTGAPLTVARHDRGLSTQIGRSVDAKGDPSQGRNDGNSDGSDVSRNVASTS